MTSQNRFSKNTLDKIIKSKGNSHNLKNEYKNHEDFEKKLNIYGNFYDNYNNKLVKNIEKISDSRKNINEDYHKNKNIHHHMEEKLSKAKRNLIISIIFLIIILVSTFVFAKMVFS